MKLALRAIATAALAAGIVLSLSAPTAQTGSPPKCFGKVVTILGDNGDDNIKGTNGNDVIDARSGENDVNGREGNDRICGGKDGDDIFGNKGNDKMGSGGGIDFIAGKAGDDLHIGGGGDDQIDAVQDATDNDEDTVRGEKGPGDFLDVADGEGDDRVTGGDGNNDTCLADVGDSVGGDCENL
jgi:Ca2+-binding RTX toxin-like protein